MFFKEWGDIILDMSEDQRHEFVGQPIRNKSYFSSNCVSKSSMTSP